MTNRLASQLRRKLKHKVLQSHLQALHSLIRCFWSSTFSHPSPWLPRFPFFKAFASSKPAWWCCQSSTASGPTKSWKQVWKGVPISIACGDLHLQPTTFLHKHFSFPSVSTFVSHASWTCNPNSILGLPCTIQYPGSRIQSLQKVFPIDQGQACPSWTGPSLLEGARQSVHSGSHSTLRWQSRLPVSGTCPVQEWQPRLNYPFICQLFHPRKGMLKKPAMNTNAQFGLATLWRRCEQKFTPIVWNFGPSSIPWGQTPKPDLNKPKCSGQRWGSHSVLYITSIGKQHPGALSHSLPSSCRRFHQMVERQTSTPSLSAPCPMVLGSKNLQRTLKQFLWKWRLQVLAYQVPCHTRSFKTVFIKHASVLDH